MEKKQEATSKKIRIIGYGTLGSYLADKINSEADLSLEFIYTILKKVGSLF